MVVYLHHRELKEGGIVAVEARRFPYKTEKEALAQAAHDLGRKGSAPLVDSIQDKDGKVLYTRKQIEEAVR